VANFDARFDTPLEEQNIVGGQVLLDEGVDNARVITPHDVWRSIALLRASSVDAIRMPPLAHNETDHGGMALLRQWIVSLPGRDVVPPPIISPGQGNYSQPIDVTLRDDEPGAVIRYTVDGSLPTSSDAVYEKPIHLAGPTILRAKAFKAGLARSITAQEVFVVGN
jgi:hypothetical protein